MSTNRRSKKSAQPRVELRKENNSDRANRRDGSRRLSSGRSDGRAGLLSRFVSNVLSPGRGMRCGRRVKGSCRYPVGSRSVETTRKEPGCVRPFPGGDLVGCELRDLALWGRQRQPLLSKGAPLYGGAADLVADSGCGWLVPGKLEDRATDRWRTAQFLLLYERGLWRRH